MFVVRFAIKPLLLMTLLFALTSVAASAVPLTQASDSSGCFDNDSYASATTGVRCNGPNAAGSRGLVDARSVVISPDGEFAYAAGFEGDTITAFDRDTSTGGLTQLPGAGEGCYTETDISFDAYIHLFPTHVAECTIQKHLNGVTDLTIDSGGQNLYAVSGPGNAIVAFARNATTGALTPMSYDCFSGDVVSLPSYSCPFADVQDATSVTMSPNSRYVFTTIGGASSVYGGGISVARRNLIGELHPESCISAIAATGCTQIPNTSDTRDAAQSPEGAHLYSVNAGSDTITAFSVAPSTGALTPLTGTDACVSNDLADTSCAGATVASIDEPSGVAVSRDGKFVYVTAKRSDAVSIFRRDADPASSHYGALTQLPANAGACWAARATAGCVDLTGGGEDPEKVVVSADGEALYVASSTSDSVIVFDREKTSGKIKQLPSTFGCIEDTAIHSGKCETATALNGANNLAVSPDDKFLYVAGRSTGESVTGTIAANPQPGSVAVLKRKETTVELPPVTDTTSSTPEVPATEATTTTTPEAPQAASACKSLTAAKKDWAVTKWKALPQTRVRLESKSGAYVLQKEKTARVLLKSRGIDGGTARVGTIVYYLDGEKYATKTSKSPHLTLRPTSLSSGAHKIKAVVFAKGSATKKTSVSMTVTVGTCELARYTFAMSSKLRRAHPNLRLWLQSGDYEVTQARAKLPTAISVRAEQMKKYVGRTIGGFKVTTDDGSSKYWNLKIPKAKTGGSFTLLKTATGIKLTMEAKTGGTVRVTGLASDTRSVRIWLRGKTIKLFKNKDRCASVVSAAQLVNSTSKLSFSEKTKLCSTQR